MTRRTFLRSCGSLAATALGAAVLAACGGSTAGAPAGSSPVGPSTPGSAAASASAAVKPSTASAGASGGGKKVRYGGLNSLNDAGVLVAMDQGYFAEQGIDVEVVTFRTAVDMVPQLSNGQLETGGGAQSAGLWNAVNRGVPVKIAADLGHADAAAPGWSVTSFMVRTALMDSGKVKSAADLKGLTVVVPPKGNQGELLLTSVLKTGNLTTKDIKGVQLPITETAAALINGKVDASLMIEPFTTNVLKQGAGKILVRDYDVLPGNQAAVLLFGPDFAKSELATPFMIAYLKAVRLYNDAFGKKLPEARTKVIKALSSHTALKDPALYDKIQVARLDPSGQPNVKSLQDQQDFFIAAGEQQKQVDLSTVVDMKFAKAAVAKLGPYSA